MKSTYLLLVLAAIAAILALTTGNFLFKSGTAAIGILIMLVLSLRKGAPFSETWWIIAAFAFSIGGDWFLSHKGGDAGLFIKGIALFFMAHLGYLGYTLRNGRLPWKFTGVLLAGYLLFFFLVLYPAIADSFLMIAALCYLFVSCFSAGAAMGMDSAPQVKWLFVLGIFSIVFSDTIIALTEFVGYSEMDFLILPTYYLSHLLVSFSLIKRFEN